MKTVMLALCTRRPRVSGILRMRWCERIPPAGFSVESPCPLAGMATVETRREQCAFTQVSLAMREGLEGSSSGRWRPLLLGVEHRGQREPPPPTEKADVDSRTRAGRVDGTPAVPSRSCDDHSDAADASLVATLPEMRTATLSHVHQRRTRRTSTIGEAHFCISRMRNAVAPNKKAASRRFKFCWGNIAAHIRSLNSVG